CRSRTEGGNIGNDERRLMLFEHLGFGLYAALEGGVKRLRTTDCLRFVDRQAVDLGHACVGFAGLQLERRARRLRKQPRRGAAADQDAKVRASMTERVDDFEIA